MWCPRIDGPEENQAILRDSMGLRATWILGKGGYEGYPEEGFASKVRF
jgi:hypothetical protein